MNDEEIREIAKKQLKRQADIDAEVHRLKGTKPQGS